MPGHDRFGRTIDFGELTLSLLKRHRLQRLREITNSGTATRPVSTVTPAMPSIPSCSARIADERSSPALRSVPVAPGLVGSTHPGCRQDIRQIDRIVEQTGAAIVEADMLGQELSKIRWRPRRRQPLDMAAPGRLIALVASTPADQPARRLVERSYPNRSRSSSVPSENWKRSVRIPAGSADHPRNANPVRPVAGRALIDAKAGQLRCRCCSRTSTISRTSTGRYGHPTGDQVRRNSSPDAEAESS